MHLCRMYPTPRAILYLYKCHIKPKIECFLHMLTGDAQSSLSTLHKMQKRLRLLVGDKYPIASHCCIAISVVSAHRN